jgi:CRP/FNR family transcriptional regulator
LKDRTALLETIAQKFPEIDDESLLSEMVDYSQILKVKEGKSIIEYGAQITHVPLVLAGAVKVSRQDEKDHEIFLYYLTDGDSCAASFSCCLVQKRSEIMAVAEEDSEILMVPLQYADKWMGKYAEWRNFIINMYDQRLFSLIDTIDRLAFSKLDEQLMDYLEMKSMAIDSEIIETTHQNIAMDLNVTREAISRLLKKLERSGKLKLGRNKIQLIS